MAASSPLNGQSDSLSSHAIPEPPQSRFSPSTSATPPLDPSSVMWEHMLASFARPEAKIDGKDQRAVPTDTVQCPDPAPPYYTGLPRSNWQPQPGIHAVQTPSVTVATPSQLGFTPSGANFSGGLSQPFQHMPANQPHQFSTPMVHGLPNSAQAIPTIPYSYPPSTYIPVDQVNPNFGSSFVNPNPSMQAQLPTSWDPPGSNYSVGQQRQVSSWDNPTARPSQGLPNPEKPRFVKMEPPRFNGSDATNWVLRVQYYFDHLLMPDEHRLHYVVMLLSPQLQNGFSIIDRPSR